MAWHSLTTRVYGEKKRAEDQIVDQSNVRARRENPEAYAQIIAAHHNGGKNSKHSVVTCTNGEIRTGSLHTDPNLGRHDNTIREKVSYKNQYKIHEESEQRSKETTVSWIQPLTMMVRR
jgi:hypothetical protein